MRKIREVLRLRWECKLPLRAIARSCGISHSTVCEYLQRVAAAGLSWPLPAELDEDTLMRRLFPPPALPSARQSPTPDWAEVHIELQSRKDVTLRLLWIEYREEHPQGLGYSQCCELYARWTKRLKPSMRQTHRAGEKVSVDYAGQTVPVTDPHSGEIRCAQVFVAALGASHYLYAEAHWSQDLPVTLRAIMGQVSSAKLGQASSPKLGQCLRPNWARRLRPNWATRFRPNWATCLRPNWAKCLRPNWASQCE